MNDRPAPVPSPLKLGVDTRHKLLCFLADWIILTLPPGVSEFSRLEIWDKEYDYRNSQHSDATLYESAIEAGYDMKDIES